MLTSPGRLGLETGTFVVRKCNMRRADRHKRSVSTTRPVFHDVPDVSVRPRQPLEELRSLQAPSYSGHSRD